MTATATGLADAHRLHQETITALESACGPAATDDDLLASLTFCEGATRALDRVVVAALADLHRRGTFTARGYRDPAAAVADLLGIERFEARRRVGAAEHLMPRVALDGTVLAAKLAATAEVFGTGGCSLRHVEVIARVLDTPTAGRLSPQVWAGIEAELADKAAVYTPAELRGYGTDLINGLDADGPEPDDHDPEPVNELHLLRNRDGSGGKLKGSFADPLAYAAIATLLDAKSKPLDSHDDRPLAQRQADALAEICGYVLDHGADAGVPETGGFRPHINTFIRLEDLEARARAAMLDFAGQLTPAALRHLACDAAVVPIVLDGVGQPLDVGRATRTVPDGLRRAVAARDRGCAFPGCDRPISWSECHHIVKWEHHGETKLCNLVMLCRHHHRLLHRRSGWTVRIPADGIPEFIPPAWIDHTQTPRRKPVPHTRT